MSLLDKLKKFDKGPELITEKIIPEPKKVEVRKPKKVIQDQEQEKSIMNSFDDIRFLGSLARAFQVKGYSNMKKKQLYQNLGLKFLELSK